MATKAAKETIEDEVSPGMALIFSEINEEVAQDICTWIIAENIAENAPEVLTLFINSPGGDLAAAFSMIELIRASRIPVRTISLGQCASAALLLAQSGAKGMRVVTPTCSVMSHSFSTSNSGSYYEIKDTQKELDRLDKLMVEHYVKCTGLDAKTVKTKLLSHKDSYLSPEDAVKFNLFDCVSEIGELLAFVPSSAPIKKARQSNKKKVETNAKTHFLF